VKSSLFQLKLGGIFMSKLTDKEILAVQS